MGNCTVTTFLLLVLTSCAVTHGNDGLGTAISQLQSVTPNSIADFNKSRTGEIERNATALHSLAAQAALNRSQTSATAWLGTTSDLLITKAHVDASLNKTLELRSELLSIESDTEKREAIRQFLSITSELIELSGRIRYSLREAISTTAFYCARDRAKRLELLDLLIKHKSGIGAGVMAVLLEDPPEGSRAPKVDDFVKGKVLVLLAVTEESDLLPQVAKLIRNQETSGSLVVMATECVQRMGLPQDPHPGQDPDLPPPAITASELHQRLKTVDASILSARSAGHRTTLLKWLDDRKTKGVTENEYRFFGHKVREGDWLLMRNPSPYNLFTDLSPGLFTHVGVVATDVDEKGIRRFVIVDLPERGEKIPVSNVDAYILETLHYFFLRHPDEAVAKQMAATARQMVGNPTQFDLNFDTSRVAAYRDGELKGRTIHTYCAGFLLICAMRSEAPLEEFFPIREQAAAGNTQDNLKALGLSIADQFVSPTAALFSPKLQIVGRRRPMYDPAREVQEAVYDHFASQMQSGTMHPSPDAVQALRQKLAEVSANNVWLRRALAKASGVSERMDLASAAKAAAVVETLDEIAEQNRDEFLLARSAFFGVRTTTDSRRTDTEQTEIEKMRERHTTLYQLWRDRKATPQQVQSQLVTYYSDRGRSHLDDRFFTSKSSE